jgi:hypothetical protein
MQELKLKEVRATIANVKASVDNSKGSMIKQLEQLLWYVVYIRF